MSVTPPRTRVVVLGEPVDQGAYVLRIRVAAPIAVHFGRLCHGAPVDVPRGDYVYVGSAMGLRGSSTLSRRLLRHCARSDGRPPHALAMELRNRLGVAELPPAQKRCHWHVDYLLDEPAATLAGVIALRSDRPHEAMLAALLAADPRTVVLVPGLGASDRRGQTHLLRVDTAGEWWSTLIERVQAQLCAATDV